MRRPPGLRRPPAALRHRGHVDAVSRQRRSVQPVAGVDASGRAADRLKGRRRGARLVASLREPRLDIDAEPIESKVNMTLPLGDPAAWAAIRQERAQPDSQGRGVGSQRRVRRTRQPDGVLRDGGRADARPRLARPRAAVSSTGHRGARAAGAYRARQERRRDRRRARRAHVQGSRGGPMGGVPQGVLRALSEHAALLGVHQEGLHRRLRPIRFRPIDAAVGHLPLQAAVGRGRGTAPSGTASSRRATRGRRRRCSRSRLARPDVAAAAVVGDPAGGPHFRRYLIQ